MSSVEITKKAKSTVLEQKVNQYEQSYLRQVELSRTKDMSVTPEKKFVNSLLEILKINKNEKTLNAFIKMMESAHDEDITDYEN